VSYRVGEFLTAPQGTKFFVFDSLEHADEFRRLDPISRFEGDCQGFVGSGFSKS
jgi:hypothetical protein